MENNEEIPSTPATPGTPGAPLFGGLKKKGNDDKNKNIKKWVKKSCKCLSVEDGRLPVVSCSLGHPPPAVVPIARKVGAEFIGTFILMFAGTAAAIVNEKTKGSVSLIGCAATTGLAVMIVILSTGHISGAHLNPAVTISFAALKHFPWKHVPIYIGAQVLASICSGYSLKLIYQPFITGGVTLPSNGYGYAQAFSLEFIISFNLMFVVTAVATDTRPVGELAGIAVGATVMLNILIAGPVSGGSMNPVRTLGPAVAANNYKAIWVYMLAPIFGALAGAGTYTAVKLPQEDHHANSKPSSITTLISTSLD